MEFKQIEENKWIIYNFRCYIIKMIKDYYIVGMFWKR